MFVREVCTADLCKLITRKGAYGKEFRLPNGDRSDIEARLDMEIVRVRIITSLIVRKFMHLKPTANKDHSLCFSIN